jgi:carboxylate-amine ligase
VKLMMEAGVIPDYTYLWFDVRPHPRLGTVEVRVFDQQTRLESTAALAALVVSLVHRYSTLFDEQRAMIEVPTELIDDNKVRAALRGMDGELVDLPEAEQRPAAVMASRLLDELREHAQEVGCEAELDGIRVLVERGTGAHRQLEVLSRSDDVGGLVRALCEATRTDSTG